MFALHQLSATTIARRLTSILFTFAIRAIDKTKLSLIEIHPICRDLELSGIEIEVILAQDEDSTEIAVLPSNIETLDSVRVSTCRIPQPFARLQRIATQLHTSQVASLVVWPTPSCSIVNDAF